METAPTIKGKLMTIFDAASYVFACGIGLDIAGFIMILFGKNDAKVFVWLAGITATIAGGVTMISQLN